MKVRGTQGQISLSVDLVDAKTAPTEFRIFRAGENQSEKGTFIFDEKSALSVMENYSKHGKALLFDFNHGVTFKNPTPEMAVSAGDFVPQVRGGELWATLCNWNGYGREMLESGKYRFFSPLFQHENGRITWLRNVALTNLPALDQIEPLVAAAADGNEGDDTMKCEACDAKDAKMAALAAEFEAFKKKKAAEPDGDEKMSALRSSVVALTGESDLDAAVGILRANKQAAGEVAAIKAETARVAEVKLSADFEALVDEAVTKTQVLPAEKAEFRADYLVDGKITTGGLKALSAFVKRASPKLNTTATKQNQTGADIITETEKAMAKLMGIDATAYAKRDQPGAA